MGSSIRNLYEVTFSPRARAAPQFRKKTRQAFYEIMITVFQCRVSLWSTPRFDDSNQPSALFPVISFFVKLEKFSKKIFSPHRRCGNSSLLPLNNTILACTVLSHPFGIHKELFPLFHRSSTQYVLHSQRCAPFPILESADWVIFETRLVHTVYSSRLENPSTTPRAAPQRLASSPEW